MKKVSFIFFLILLSVAISTFIWSYIVLPYDNDNQIYGEYARLNYNPLNDTLRYIFFILIPLATFFSSYLLLYKERLSSIYQILNLKVIDSTETEKNKLINFFFYLTIIFLIINFLSLDFNHPYYLSKLDLYHEAVSLTPASNYEFKNELWTSTFIEYGLFGNFHPVVVWKVFNLKTIGSIRFFEILILLLNNIFLVLLSKKISEGLILEKSFKIYYFVILSIFAVSLIDYKYSHTDIPAKFFLILFFLYIFFTSTKSTRDFSYSNFFVGLFSSMSFFWYIDVGAYLNIFFIFLLIYLLFRKEYKKILFILIGILFGWILFFIFLPANEIAAFYENTKSVFTTVNYLDGIVYPTPFLSKDVRATRALLLIIVTGILIVIFNFDKKIKAKPEIKIFLSYFYLVTILVFGSAMTRSDSPHIKTASGLLIFLLASLILYFLFNILNEILKKKQFSINKSKKYFFVLPMVIIIVNFSFISPNSISLKKTISSFDEINKMLHRDNKNYLSTDLIEMINYYNSLTEGENCVQIFTNEAALPFFLNRPTCSKYYLMTMAASKENQKKFVQELAITKPKIILFDSDKVIFDDTKSRLPEVLNYIESNYTFHSKFKFWTFVKLK